MHTDYYTILGVDKTASPEEIKKAFRVRAHTHHPDKGGDEKKFKELNQAYQTLSNTEKRARYDRFGNSSNIFDEFSAQQSGFGNAENFAHFARGAAGQRFTMPSLKRVPLIMWIFLLPFILIILCVGAIILFISLIQSVRRSFK